MKTPDVMVGGKDNGEGMVIHYQTAKGTDIFGLGIPNMYLDADWDLGPTWCYLIVGQKTTLIDTGRLGNVEIFGALLKSVGKGFADIDRVVVTHSHEDHDGNLADIITAAQAEVWAHSIYREMISYHPHIEDGAGHPDLPGSCRLCNMPAKFNRNCLPYQKKRSSLSIDFVIDDEQRLPDDGLSFLFTPGHSPDSICILLEDEVLFTGDTILPDITPHPSLAYAFEINRRILPERYRQQNSVYGLMNYVKSLNKIIRLTQPLQATFPGHRLFYSGQFNIINSSFDRAKGIIQFHIDRCRDILNVIDDRPASADDIAVRYFPPSLLTGMGRSMARDEVVAHIEAMEECGDVRLAGEKKDTAQATGSQNFLTTMGAYLH